MEGSSKQQCQLYRQERHKKRRRIHQTQGKLYKASKAEENHVPKLDHLQIPSRTQWSTRWMKTLCLQTPDVLQHCWENKSKISEHCYWCSDISIQSFLLKEQVKFSPRSWPSMKVEPLYSFMTKANRIFKVQVQFCQTMKLIISTSWKTT